MGYPSGVEELTILARMGVDPPVPRAGARPGPRDARCSARADQVFVHHAMRRVRRAPGARHPRPGRATGCRTSRRPCSSASARGPRSGWSPPRGRWPCCADGATCCPATSATSRRDVLAHRLVLTFDALADGGRRRGRWCERVLAAVRAAAGHARAGRPHDRGGLTIARPSSAPSARCASGAGHPPPARRPPARRPARPPHRPRRGARRRAPLPPGRGRRPAHGLERHRPDGRAARAREHRRAGAGDLGAGRRLGEHGLRHRRMEKRDLAVAVVAAVHALTDRPGNRLGVRLLGGVAPRTFPPRPGRQAGAGAAAGAARRAPYPAGSGPRPRGGSRAAAPRAAQARAAGDRVGPAAANAGRAPRLGRAAAPARRAARRRRGGGDRPARGDAARRRAAHPRRPGVRPRHPRCGPATDGCASATRGPSSITGRPRRSPSGRREPTTWCCAPTATGSATSPGSSRSAAAPPATAGACR